MMDEFTLAYIEAALWISTDGDSLAEKYNIENIDTITMIQIHADCQKFQNENAEDIGAWSSDAGHDFAMTRNGEGCGFWDGDWDKETGDRLTEKAHAFGPYTLYVGDDGKIHGAKG